MTAVIADQAAGTTGAAVQVTDAELLAWARDNATRWHTSNPRAVVRWSGPMDNHVPVRKSAYGFAVMGVTDDGMLTMSLRTRGMVRDGHKAVYVVDDGKGVVPMVAVGYNGHGVADQVTLKQFPSNPDGKRDARGRVIDYADWWVGPSRVYHIKIAQVPDGVTL